MARLFKRPLFGRRWPRGFRLEVTRPNMDAPPKPVLVFPKASAPPPPSGAPGNLDTVIHYLAGLPEEALEEILRLAHLTRQKREMLSQLKIRLQS